MPSKINSGGGVGGGVGEPGEGDTVADIGIYRGTVGPCAPDRRKTPFGNPLKYVLK